MPHFTTVFTVWTEVRTVKTVVKAGIMCAHMKNLLVNIRMLVASGNKPDGVSFHLTGERTNTHVCIESHIQSIPKAQNTQSTFEICCS